MRILKEVTNDMIEQPFNKNDKQTEWNSIFFKIEKITDGLNLEIDSGIKETVVAFKANGFETTGSCEGHLDWGRRNPYIDIGVDISSDLKEKFANFKNKVDEKGIKSNDQLKSDSVLCTIYENLKNETAKQAKIAIPNIESRIKSLLSVFYSSHTPASKDYTLVVHSWNNRTSLSIESMNGAMSTNSKEEHDERIKKFDNLSLEEREKKLKDAQIEMQAFTKFLKDQFFKNS